MDAHGTNFQRPCDKMQQPMLTPWRRHAKDCKYRDEGRKWTKCSCPVWCDGEVNGQRIRKSLDTRTWTRALVLLGRTENDIEAGIPVVAIRVEQGCEKYLASLDLEPSSLRKYNQRIKFVVEFCRLRRITRVSDITLATLDDYRAFRKLSVLTWSKELQFLRGMFAFWFERKWIQENHAKSLKMPKDPKGREREPYTSEEITAILAATETAGVKSYERLRWRAMVLLMRFYGLRVSDVSTLERKRVTGNQIAVRAMKNGRWLWMPLYPEVAAALECVPSPGNDRYYFWSGAGKRESHINNTIMSLMAVYKASKVRHSASHRFRHTLAMQMLSEGGSIEQVADILGDDPATIRKHYKHFMPEYQRASAELLDRVHRPKVVISSSQIVPLEKDIYGTASRSALKVF